MIFKRKKKGVGLNELKDFLAMLGKMQEIHGELPKMKNPPEITKPPFSTDALEIGLVAASTGKTVDEIITLCKEAELLLRSLTQQFPAKPPPETPLP